MLKAERNIKRMLRVFRYAKEKGNINKACRQFGIPKSLYYVWYEKYGEASLTKKKPCPANLKLWIYPEIEEKILNLRKIYHPEPNRIFWYMQRYHREMSISASTVYRISKHHGINRLPKNAKKTHNTDP
ncbi:MAG: helix-turn-helix domain-containing protein [Candidatus Aminicenantes bacterium]|nr:helix-turn-helix domain-containing protein [Candidatus Aminicenantes bacterium]